MPNKAMQLTPSRLGVHEYDRSSCKVSRFESCGHDRGSWSL